MRTRFDEADHRRVTEAVIAAEQASNGEIVTIVADHSDAYHDTALRWTVVAMLGAPAVLTLVPYATLERLLGWGWAEGLVYRELLGALFALEIAIFLLMRLLLSSQPVRVALTARATRVGRVRRRAIQYFRASAEKRTIGHTGILIYLSLAEHRAEIIADEAIYQRVDPAIWGDAMAALIERMREGRAGEGLVEAVSRVGAVLAEHFPRSGGDINELPDRLIEL